MVNVRCPFFQYWNWTGVKRKSKQYEQTNACSPVNNLTCAHPSDHDLDKEDCHLHTGSVSARNLLSPERVDISYQADKIQQGDLIAYRPKPRSGHCIGDLVARQALVSRFSAKYIWFPCLTKKGNVLHNLCNYEMMRWLSKEMPPLFI